MIREICNSNWFRKLFRFFRSKYHSLCGL